MKVPNIAILKTQFERTPKISPGLGTNELVEVQQKTLEPFRKVF